MPADLPAAYPSWAIFACLCALQKGVGSVLCFPLVLLCFRQPVTHCEAIAPCSYSLEAGLVAEGGVELQLYQESRNCLS